jgi:hypothetical protein
LILLYPLVLVGAVAIAWQRRGEARGRGWGWFAAWCVAGALYTLSFLAGFSVGLFVLPLAAAAVLYVTWQAPHAAEALGVVAGAGAVLALVGLLAGDHRPCPEDGLALPAAAARSSVECGGFDGQPWLVAGILTVSLAVLCYGTASIVRRRRDERRTR